MFGDDSLDIEALVLPACRWLAMALADFARAVRARAKLAAVILERVEPHARTGAQSRRRIPAAQQAFQDKLKQRPSMPSVSADDDASARKSPSSPCVSTLPEELARLIDAPR